MTATTIDDISTPYFGALGIVLGLIVFAVAVGNSWQLLDTGDGTGDMREEVQQVTGYFVGTGGNNSNTGLSHDQRWLTLSNVSSTVLATGANVNLYSGSQITGQVLTVNWSGNVNNWVEIRCYYGSSGAEIECSGF